MLKKLGTVVVATAAGMVALGGMASASTDDCAIACGLDGISRDGSVDQGRHPQVGLVNLNGTRVAQNVDVAGAVCDNDISVLGVQVPVEDVADGVDLPVASPGQHEVISASPDFCAMSGVLDEGIVQGN
ncbi:hypothetical protein [Umezawaea sp. Da 62-37]|uniref:hypothetical protein n=1 Tax=Umezawaea sp. Da 62-37 TaxID=3075927 RepID=UPI0028F6F6D0|nr:hypothetical protein [Umezawaea sp. Da 62-37]WNV83944.1 hypothetical protein RM788_38140 [Umezawaea sp. Da 62-37]